MSDFDRRFLATAYAIGSLIACNGSTPPQAAMNACSAGQTQTCTGPDACQGQRVCGGAPAKFGACECDANPSPDAGLKPKLGAACSKNSDCPASAFCLDTHATQLFGGAPPAGTCVADCSSGPAACGRFAAAVCVSTSTPASSATKKSALCFEACTIGEQQTSKCHARAQVACAPIDDAANAAAFCRPLCTSNAECPSGACDPAHAVCVAERVTDRNFALRCDPATDTLVELDAGVDADAGAEGNAAAACAGPCVQLNDAPSLCSRRCKFGDAQECAPASGGLRRGGCLFVSQGGSIGDLGYCGELCDCSADCVEPSFVCDAFDDTTLERSFGRKGVCTDRALVTSRVLACEK